jgi:hypothetical protein
VVQVAGPPVVPVTTLPAVSGGVGYGPVGLDDQDGA